MPRILGTPNEESWPGVSKLPDYKSTFPQWSRRELAQIIPTLDAAGIDFLHVCVIDCFSQSFLDYRRLILYRKRSYTILPNESQVGFYLSAHWTVVHFIFAFSETSFESPILGRIHSVIDIPNNSHRACRLASLTSHLYVYILIVSPLLPPSLSLGSIAHRCSSIYISPILLVLTLSHKHKIKQLRFPCTSIMHCNKHWLESAASRLLLDLEETNWKYRALSPSSPLSLHSKGELHTDYQSVDFRRGLSILSPPNYTG